MAMLNNQRVNVLISDFLHQTGPQQGHVGHWPVLATRGSSWGPPLLPCSFQRSGRGDSWSFNGLIWGFYGKFMGWFLGTKQKLLGVQNLRPKFVGPRLHSFLSISTWPLANLDLSKWISSGLMWPIGRISHMKISICGWSCDGSDVLSRICYVKGRCKLAMSSVGRSPVPGACAERVEWSDWDAWLKRAIWQPPLFRAFFAALKCHFRSYKTLGWRWMCLSKESPAVGTELRGAEPLPNELKQVLIQISVVGKVVGISMVQSIVGRGVYHISIIIIVIIGKLWLVNFGIDL